MKIKSKYLEKIIILILISLITFTLAGCSSGSGSGSSSEAEVLVIESQSIDNDSPIYIALGTEGQEVIDYYLDSEVEVELSNGDLITADIAWEIPDDYDSQIEESYIFRGVYDIQDVGNGELEVEVILSEEVTSISGEVSIGYDFSNLTSSVSNVEVYEVEEEDISTLKSGEGKFIIGFSPNSKEAERKNLIVNNGGRLRKNLSSLNAAAVTVSTDAEKFIKNINKSKIVEYIEKDSKIYAVGEVIPNDPYYSDQWNLEMTALNYSWYNEKGNADIKIAVIDTGIDVNHPDLADKIDLENSYNFVDDNDEINDDDEGHGTHVAGTAAAATNNNQGIAGVGWNSGILALKALENGSGYHSDIAEAIMYAAGLSNDPKKIEAVDVINMSLGSSSGDTTLKRAVEKAAEAGVILVAAAGNNGSGLDYPAAYEEVISVAAVDSSGNIAGFSNAGSDMDLAAPGESIWSTVPDGYGYFSGTSMAAPHVSGIVSLMIARGISPHEIRERLHQASVHSDGKSYSYDYGYGIINSSLAVSNVDEIRIIISDQGSNFEIEAETSVPLKGGRYSFPSLESGVYSIYSWIDTNQDNIINTGDYLREHMNKGFSPGQNYSEDLTTYIDYNHSIK